MEEQKELWGANEEMVLLHRWLKAQRQELLEAWARGAFTEELDSATIQLNSEALGQIRIIDNLLELERADLAAV
jgi:hypothetical protein